MISQKSDDYPVFTYNNESVILKPGDQFSKNELKSRLHDMDVDAINIESKPQLVNLYESTLRDDRNKFKLFNRLRKDTEIYTSKMGISLNQRIPMSSEKENRKKERSKVINLKYNTNVDQYENNRDEDNNIRKQEIKIKKSNNRRNNNVNINKNNAFFTGANYAQNNDDTYNEEEMNNKYNKNSRNFRNNEIEYNDFRNTNNYNNYDMSNNYNKNYEKRDIEYNNNNNENMFTNKPPEDYTHTQEIKEIKNKNEDIKGTDEESSFSFLSSFSNFKISKQICFHVLAGFIIICLALCLLYIYKMFSETINGFFMNIFDIVIHPGNLISSGLGIIRDYWYIIPILLIFIIIIISLWKKYTLRKRCEEIMQKIIEDLYKERERISEEDIYRKYVQGYGVSWKTYIKTYLPILRKMRRKDTRLKNSSEKIDGKETVFWEYYE